MILKELFEDYGYHDLLTDNGKFNIQYFFDCTPEGNEIKPKELINIYLSRYGDELFLILNSDKSGSDISTLCKKWDNKLNEFCNFGCSSKESLHKFMYNMFQVILFPAPIEDRSEESSLRTSRKILLPFTLNQENDVCVSGSDANELPFYLGGIETIHNKSAQADVLYNCIPDSTEDCYSFLTKRKKHPKRKPDEEKQPKTFSPTEYEQIKGWLSKL